MSSLLQTPLHALHVELGAKMVPFAGYDMPVQYPTGVMAEHKHTRAAAGLFDVSHMGQVRLVGADAAAALETLVQVWAKELVNVTPVRVNLFDPGPTRTRLRATVMRGEEAETLPTPEEVIGHLLPLCLPSFTETGKLFDRVSGTLKDPSAD